MVYLIFIIYYSVKEISPVKVGVSKILFKEKEKELNANFEVRKTKRFKSLKKIKIEEKDIVEGNNPPKRGMVRKTTILTTEGDNIITSTDKYDFLEYKKQKKRNSKIKTKGTKNESSKHMFKNEKNTEKTTINKYKNIDVIRFDNTKKKKIMEKIDEEKMNKEKIEKDLENEQYDDYELNNMEYIDASNNDKRSCLRTYWSVLKRENYIFITFISCNDYNLFYVKIERFFVILCTEMTMNGLFFVHETMHRKYTENEDFTFVQKLPQFIFTILVTDFIEVLLCYLSMTDKAVYDIKDLVRDEKTKIKKLEKKENEEKKKAKENSKKEVGEKIMDILECMKRKLVGFFVVTFLLFLFYWYFISAFCAVYQNTQVIFLRDCGISLLTSLFESLIIYGATTILRTISLLACCRKKLGCVYKLSDLIPIF